MESGRASGSSKGSLLQQPFTGALGPKMRIRLMNSTRRQCPLAPETIFHPAHDWNTIRDFPPPISLTRTGIRSRSSIKASDETTDHHLPEVRMVRSNQSIRLRRLQLPRNCYLLLRASG